MQSYIDAFQKCYPSANVSLKFAGKDNKGLPKYWVIIDGNKGDRPLTFAEMSEAISAFNK